MASNLPQPQRPQPPAPASSGQRPLAPPTSGNTGSVPRPQSQPASQPPRPPQPAPNRPANPISGAGQTSTPPRPPQQPNSPGNSRNPGPQPSAAPQNSGPRPPAPQPPRQNQVPQSSGQRQAAPPAPRPQSQPAPRPVAPAPVAVAKTVTAPSKLAPSQPAGGSRLLQNLQNVSDKPFQDPSSPAATRPPTSSAAKPAPTFGAKPVSASQATPSTVPSELPGAAPTAPPTSGGRKAASAGSGLLSQPKKLLMVLGAVLFVGVLGFVAWWFFSSRSSSTPSPTGSTSSTSGRTTNLTYWGLWEPAEVMKPLIDQYQAKNPNVKITYVQQNSRQYRQRLQAAVRDGSGPDIFRFHNTWTPMLGNELSAAPSSVFSAETMRRDYYPVVTTNLVSDNKVLGVPLMYDGLALLYNKNMLQAANALPPTDWQQVRELALRLTIRSGERLERGGIALGTAENVDHFSDILGLMMLQNSADISNPTTPNAVSALEFYTMFANTDRVWDNTMPHSVQAFSSEQVAMIFVPSWRIPEIQKLNPNLSFGVTRLPQIDGTSVAWATYWAEGVSAQSKNKEEAWKFLAYLSEAEQLRAFQNQASSIRGYGELYPKVQMASELKQNPLMSAYLEDALIARSWALSSETFDEGINDGLIQYYKDAVNLVNQGGAADRALQSILPGIQQVLSRYGLAPVSAPSTTP